MVIDTMMRKFAGIRVSQFRKWDLASQSIQEQVFRYLLRHGRKTVFGKEHHFNDITDYESFKNRVPIIDYEGLTLYLNKIIQGERSVLWPGRPAYLAITSGTASGNKFIPVKDTEGKPSSRISLKDIRINIHYNLIINTNGGLWGYNTGDIIRFESVNPYRIRVTGRTSQFTSTFGEHIIASEAEDSIQETARITRAEIMDFTLAPLADNQGGKPCHQWFVEFTKEPCERK